MTRWRPLSEPGGPEPRRVRESLGRYRTPLVAVLEAWDGVVGADIARHGRPIAVRDGVLVVEVDDPAWAGQLTWLGPDLLARLGERLGTAVAERIDIRVRRP